MCFESIGKAAGGCFAALTAMALTVVVGCQGDTPATLQSGTGENALDGAVISDDGNTVTFNLSEDGTSLDEVEIMTADGGTERVAFDEPAEAGAVAVPREIDTSAGNSFAFNRDTNSAQVTTTLPFQSNPTTFNVNLDSNPFEQTARRANQAGDGVACEDVRDSVDGFCDFFQANADARKDELISVATEIALEQSPDSVDPFVPGVVSDVINDFFNTLSAVCNAWADMRDLDTVNPCDPCSGESCPAT